jgi:hypothetical protein
MKCPHCGEMISIFGESGLDSYAASKGIDILGRLPLDSSFAGLCDKGQVEDIVSEDFDQLVYRLKTLSE